MSDEISKISPHRLRHERRRLSCLRSAIRDDPPPQPASAILRSPLKEKQLHCSPPPLPLRKRPPVPGRITVPITYIPPPPHPPLRPPIKRTPRKPLSEKQRMNIQRQPTNQQTGSLFFKLLPAEIRLQIYEALLSHGKVHIDWPYVPPVDSTEPSDSGWYHGICSNGSSQDPFWKDSCLASDWSYSSAEKGLLKADTLDISMLYTCRLVYSEIISTLYSINTFHISYVPTLHLFSKSILTERLAAIKSLDFVWRLQALEHPTVGKTPKNDYDDMWSVLHSFSGLRSLRVAIRTEDRPMAHPSMQDLRHIREAWLSPLEPFKDLEVFEIAVPQRLKECLELAFQNSAHRLLDLGEPSYLEREKVASRYSTTGTYGHVPTQYYHLRFPSGVSLYGHVY